MILLRARIALAVVGAYALCCAAPSQAPSAATIHAMGEAESNPAKSVQLLCQAADLAPGNLGYRGDCNASRASVLAGDKQMLRNAQEAFELGLIPKAKKYAKFVTTLDPALYKQAEDLLGKMSVATTESGSNSDAQKALLAQAASAYQSGNLAAAKAAAQGVTDVALKSPAAQILTDVANYSNLVSTGSRQEQAKQYAEAERSYQSALAINAHVGTDDLASKVLRARNLAAASTVAQTGSGPAVVKNTPKPPSYGDLSKNQKSPMEVSPEEKKRRLLDEGASAMSRNDLDTAGKKFKQVLDLDPANAEAKNGINQITATLNKDPARLEKTLREAIVAYYASHFEDAESRFNRYLGADGGKKKGAAYFYLGATEATLGMLDDAPKRAARTRQAQEDFKQAREAGYQPIDALVSSRVLGVWKSSGM